MGQTTMPASFRAGTTVEYTRSSSTYPASDGWTLSVYVAGEGVIEAVTALGSGSEYAVEIPASATAKLPPGNYTWQEQVTKGGKVHPLESGVVEIQRNIAMAGAGDMQSFSEKMLTAVRAVIAGRIPADVENYQVSGVAITKMPVADLMKLESSLERQVNSELFPGRFGTPVEVAFPRATSTAAYPPEWMR